MARPKKSPEEEMQNVIGVKLTDDLAERVRTIGERWGLKPASAGRELLLFGLSLIESLERQGAIMPFLNLTDTFRRPTSEMSQDKSPTQAADQNTTLEKTRRKPAGKVSDVPGAEYYAQVFGSPKRTDSNQARSGDTDEDVNANPLQRKESAAAAAPNGHSGTDP